MVRRLRPRALDVRIVILPHRGCVQEAVPRRLRHIAVLRIDRVQLHDHGVVGCVIADPADDAASGDVLADERGEVHGAAAFDIDGFGVGPAGAGQAGQKQRQICKGHETPVLNALV